MTLKEIAPIHWYVPQVKKCNPRSFFEFKHPILRALFISCRSTHRLTNSHWYSRLYAKLKPTTLKISKINFTSIFCVTNSNKPRSATQSLNTITGVLLISCFA